MKQYIHFRSIGFCTDNITNIPFHCTHICILRSHDGKTLLLKSQFLHICAASCNLLHNLNHTKNFLSRTTGINVLLKQQGMGMAQLQRRRNYLTEASFLPSFILLWSVMMVKILSSSSKKKYPPYKLRHITQWPSPQETVAHVLPHYHESRRQKFLQKHLCKLHVDNNCQRQLCSSPSGVDERFLSSWISTCDR
jgi:hypothetical protein